MHTAGILSYVGNVYRSIIYLVADQPRHLRYRVRSNALHGVVQIIYSSPMCGAAAAAAAIASLLPQPHAPTLSPANLLRNAAQ